MNEDREELALSQLKNNWVFELDWILSGRKLKSYQSTCPSRCLLIKVGNTYQTP